MTKEIPNKEEILDKRQKDLSDKAKAETSAISSYEKTTQRLYEESPKIVEGAMDKLMEVYVDNLRQNGKKTAGFGTKMYNTLNDYLTTECFGFQKATKDLGNEVLNKLVESYIGINAKSVDKELEDEEKVSIAMFDGLKSQVGKTLGQKLNSAYIESIKETASEDTEGFRTYVTKLANDNKVEFKPNELQSLEGLFNIYLQAAQELLNEKMKNKKKGKK